MDDYTFNRTYRDVQPISKGGTGIIYRAYHCNLDKYVVLKNIIPGQDPAIMRREVDILKNLKHRYLPAIYDFIEYNGMYYIVEDYISGKDLTYFLDNKIFLPEEYIVKWLCQLCEVLDYLHSRTPIIIHSDIKPGNIMIDSAGDICLIDFNISIFHGKNSRIVGYSNHYCAPEQMQQAVDIMSGIEPSKIRKVDLRADIYSTAATFYSLLSGRTPAVAGNNPSLAKMGLPYSEGLLRLLDKCMDPVPAKRCQNAKQMLNLLNHLEMMTQRYEVYRKLRAAVTVGGVVLTAVGILLCIYGGQLKLTSGVDSGFAAISSQFYNEGATETVAQKAKAFLNNSGYERILDGRPVNKAQIYAILGEYEFNLDTFTGYINAANYYKTALTLLDDADANADQKKTYAMNYIAALALSGDTEQAQLTAYQYIPDTESAEYTAVKAELAYSEGKYGEVLGYAQEIRNTNGSSELKKSVYTLAALACEKQSDFEEAVIWNELISGLSGTQQSLRRTACVLVRAGNFSSKTEYYERALTCYSGITLTAEDTVGYAEALLGLGRYEECLSKLNTVITMDNALLCKANYIKASACMALNRTEEARKACQSAVASYNMLPNGQKKSSIDVSSLMWLCSQLNVSEELK